MTQIVIFACVLLVLSSPGVRAQPQQSAQMPPAATGRYVDAVNGLSLADAVGQALAREPSLRAARSEVEVARGMRQQAALRPNPTTSFERREEPGGTDSQTMVSVEIPLDLFRRDARVTAADRELEAVQRGVDDQTRLAVAEVRMRYGASSNYCVSESPKARLLLWSAT